MSGVNIEVSKELIAPIIESKIAAAICEHVGSPALFVDRIVSAALKTKVDDSGRVNSSAYYNTKSFLDVIVTQTIQDSTRDAVRLWVQKNQPLIQAAVEKELARTKSGMAKAFAAGLADAIKADFRFNVSVAFKDGGDR